MDAGKEQVYSGLRHKGPVNKSVTFLDDPLAATQDSAAFSTRTTIDALLYVSSSWKVLLPAMLVTPALVVQYLVWSFLSDLELDFSAGYNHNFQTT